LEAVIDVPNVMQKIKHQHKHTELDVVIINSQHQLLEQRQHQLVRKALDQEEDPVHQRQSAALYRDKAQVPEQFQLVDNKLQAQKQTEQLMLHKPVPLMLD
jgi:hypothetical protein